MTKNSIFLTVGIVVALALVGVILIINAGNQKAPTEVTKTVFPNGMKADSVPPVSAHEPPSAAEVAAAKAAGTQHTIITTAKGVIEADLYGADMPLTVANFVKLANAKFYDGLTFHRVVPDFVIQSGDPEGTGNGGPGYEIKFESSKLKHGLGSLAMARSASLDSAGSQFYITLSDNAQVKALDDPKSPYAVFGKVTKGLDVAQKIAKGDKIISVTITK